MPTVYVAYYPDGTTAYVGETEVAKLRANNVRVDQVDPSQVTQDATGQIHVSVAALQQQQAIANSLAQAAALRAQEQNAISAYGALTTRGGMYLGAGIPLLGQAENYGVQANILAGDERAPYMALPAALSRMAGVQQTQPNYAGIETYDAGEASDIVRRLAGEQTSAEKQSGSMGGGASAKPTAGETTGTPTSTGPSAAPAAAPATTAAPTTTAPSTTAPSVVSPAATTSAIRAGFGAPTTQFPWGVPSQLGSQFQQGVQATALRPEGPRSAGGRGEQSAWESRRDALLGGQRHDDFQAEHGVTAQELNDVAKIGDAGGRQKAFQELLKRRPTGEAHGSNWRASGDRSGSAYKHGNTFDYNAAPTQTFHQPQDRSASESGRNTRGAWSVTRGGQNQQNQQQAQTQQQTGQSGAFSYGASKKKKKEPKDYTRAEGGTDIMPRRPMFTRAGGGTDPLAALMGGGGAPPMDAGLPPLDAGGLPPLPEASAIGPGGLDPHNPDQSPENLTEIAAILSSPPSPSPSALEAAVRECWSMGPDGQPVYTKNFEEAAAVGAEALPDGGLPIPPDALDMGMGGAPNGPAGPLGYPMGGAPPLPPEGGPMPFQRGGTRRLAEGGSVYGREPRVIMDNRPEGFDGWYDQGGLRTRPTQPRPAVSGSGLPTSGPPPPRSTISGSGLPTGGPPASKPPGAVAPPPTAVSGARAGAAPRPARASAQPATPAGPTAEEQTLMSNYAAAQFGMSPEDAWADMQGNPEYLRSVLGMARAGELAGYATFARPVDGGTEPPPPAATADYTRDPAFAEAVRWRMANTVESEADARHNLLNPANRNYTESVLGMVRSGEAGRQLGTPASTATTPLPPGYSTVNGLPVGGRVTGGPPTGSGVSLADRHPVPGALDTGWGPGKRDNLGAPSQVQTNPAVGQSIVDAIRERTLDMTPDETRQWMSDLIAQLAGATVAGGAIQRAQGGTDVLPNPTLRGPNTFVAKRPTLFNAGTQDFIVGEGTLNGKPGADELVSVVSSPQGTVVHVDPLQRRGTGVPASVAATANLAVPGSPYRAKAGPPASPTQPGNMAMAQGGTLMPPLVAPAPVPVPPPAASIPSPPKYQPVVRGARPTSYATDTGTHEGGWAADIFADTGTDIYAPIGGESVPAVYPNGGNATILHGDDGRYYYFAHGNAGFTGGRVEAGQSIGQVGQTGNAGTTDPHLHFAIASDGNFDRGIYGGSGDIPFGEEMWDTTSAERAIGGTDLLPRWRYTDYSGPPIPEQRYVLPALGGAGGSAHGGWTGIYPPEAETDPLDPRQAVPLPIPPAPWSMASGGTVYGTPIAQGATIKRVGTQPSASGQVTVPGGKKKTTTQPFFMAQPFPEPEFALSQDVARMTPQQWQSLGWLTQQRRGFGASEWQARQQQAQPYWQKPAMFGTNLRPF